MANVKRMHQTSQQLPADGDPRPQTPGATVLGWLLICFAVAPLAMAADRYGTSYLWVGAGMVFVGAVLVLVARLGHSRRE